METEGGGKTVENWVNVISDKMEVGDAIQIDNDVTIVSCLDGVRKDESTHSTTIRAGQESTTYSLVYKRIDVVKPSDLTITNDKNAEFESSVSENIVTLTLTEVQDVDVNFTIKYKYTQE